MRPFTEVANPDPEVRSRGRIMNSFLLPPPSPFQRIRKASSSYVQGGSSSSSSTSSNSSSNISSGDATALQYWFHKTRTGLQLGLSAPCPFTPAVRQGSCMTRVWTAVSCFSSCPTSWLIIQSMRKYGCITPALLS